MGEERKDIKCEKKGGEEEEDKKMEEANISQEGGFRMN